MSQELHYTSVPRGLKPGARGFCTVACTAGLSPTLAERLEGLSGYRAKFPPGHPEAATNPVAWSHVRLSAAGQTASVVSRVGPAGLDYTDRPNKYAHHLVLEAAERPLGGPAWLLEQPGIMATEWTSPPQQIHAGRRIPQGDGLGGICRAWADQTGDAGWAGAVAESFLNDPRRQVVLMFDPGTDVLGLFAEAIALLPPERRWEVTFQTYFTGLPPGMTCAWRGVLRDSPEERQARGNPDALLIDLSAPDGRAAGGALVHQARTGEAPTVAPPAAQSPATHPEASPAPTLAAVPPRRAAKTAPPPPTSHDSYEPGPPAPPPVLPLRSPRKKTFSRWPIVAATILAFVLGSACGGTAVFVLLQSNLAAVPAVPNQGPTRGAEKTATIEPKRAPKHIAKVKPVSPSTPSEGLETPLNQLTRSVEGGAQGGTNNPAPAVVEARAAELPVITEPKSAQQHSAKPTSTEAGPPASPMPSPPSDERSAQNETDLPAPTPIKNGSPTALQGPAMEESAQKPEKPLLLNFWSIPPDADGVSGKAGDKPTVDRAIDNGGAIKSLTLLGGQDHAGERKFEIGHNAIGPRLEVVKISRPEASGSSITLNPERVGFFLWEEKVLKFSWYSDETARDSKVRQALKDCVLDVELDDGSHNYLLLRGYELEPLLSSKVGFEIRGPLKKSQITKELEEKKSKGWTIRLYRDNPDDKWKDKSSLRGFVYSFTLRSPHDKQLRFTRDSAALNDDAGLLSEDRMVTVGPSDGDPGQIRVGLNYKSSNLNELRDVARGFDQSSGTNTQEFNLQEQSKKARSDVDAEIDRWVSMAKQVRESGFRATVAFKIGGRLFCLPERISPEFEAAKEATP